MPGRNGSALATTPYHRRRRLLWVNITTGGRTGHCNIIVARATGLRQADRPKSPEVLQHPPYTRGVGDAGSKRSNAATPIDTGR